MLESLVSALKNSIRGLKRAVLTERAIRQEFILLLITVPLSLFLAPSFFLSLLLICSVIFVLITEILNTCIEKLCDHVTPEFHDTIGYIKDLGSAAVFCALVLSLCLWGYVLLWL